MRYYLVQGGVCLKCYASTNADATATRNTIVEETGAKKKDVTIEQTDVPTAKAELLEFINELCAELDEESGE